MTTSPLLSVQDFSRCFAPGAPPAVDNVSFDLNAGEILALIGPSGCGKTTTLRMIAGFERPEAGLIHVRGRDVTELSPDRRGIGMVFQDYALFPHMTVAQNISFGMLKRDHEAVSRFLAMVGLEGLGARYPDELSGGQQQRVALARSFAAEPDLILLDEPFSNLDASLRSATRREIRSLLKASGIGIVFVTHDQEEALSFADRVVVMRDGKALQTGTPAEVYDRPVDAFVAGFLGRNNLVPGEAKGNHADTPLGSVLLCGPAEGAVMLCIRPEKLKLQRDGQGGGVFGEVTACEFKGHDRTYWVRAGDRDWQVDAMEGERLPIGTKVAISIVGTAVPLRSD